MSFVGLVILLFYVGWLSQSRAGKSLLLLVILVLLVTTPHAVASDVRFGAGAGVFDTLDGMADVTGSLTLESKSLPALWGLRPTLQLLVINGSGYYIGAGILKDFSINSVWICGLGFSAGLAHESKENRVLDYDLEFYTRVFLTRQINASNALRLEFGHISNGGLDKSNPGTEPLILYWLYRF